MAAHALRNQPGNFQSLLGRLPAEQQQQVAGQILADPRLIDVYNNATASDQLTELGPLLEQFRQQQQAPQNELERAGDPFSPK